MKEFGLSTLRTIAISAFTVLAVYGIQTQASSWTAPGSTPPNGNVAGPITTSGGQTINGNLSLGNNGNLWVGGRVYVPDVWLSSVNKWASEMGAPSGTVVAGCTPRSNVLGSWNECWGGAGVNQQAFSGASNFCPTNTTARIITSFSQNSGGDPIVTVFLCTKN